MIQLNKQNNFIFFETKQPILFNQVVQKGHSLPHYTYETKTKQERGQEYSRIV